MKYGDLIQYKLIDSNYYVNALVIENITDRNRKGLQVINLEGNYDTAMLFIEGRIEGRNYPINLSYIASYEKNYADELDYILAVLKQCSTYEKEEVHSSFDERREKIYLWIKPYVRRHIKEVAEENKE